ncbi:MULTISPECIES: hypothetical protein [Brevibacillus]|uniref:hypothetical protein n=1 Tax=Brevibacillus TaxID=55080 RepID=UPI0011B26D40|nr:MULTISPECIES: hypothetical protein [Brevibacillus]MED1945680.1 hypothetical protein [Brevibacillus formosus]MED2000687.1 hypothetical protein [Brevibacillus formosus]MED2084467.1 hypothetical protein [Brevibacillus formosus]
MRRPYLVGIFLYILVLVPALDVILSKHHHGFQVLVVLGKKLAFSWLVIATIVFSLYCLLIFTYRKGRLPFMSAITVSVVVISTFIIWEVYFCDLCYPAFHVGPIKPPFSK